MKISFFTNDHVAQSKEHDQLEFDLMGTEKNPLESLENQ